MIFNTIVGRGIDAGPSQPVIDENERRRLTAISRLERVLWSRGLMHVAGIDEAGRGPLAGPVVAAAVIFPPGMMIAGVDDSKKLTPDHREELYAQIVGSASAYGIAMIDHDEIDRINILQATIEAMRNSIRQLRFQPDYLLVDGNMFHHESIPFRTIVRGDSRSISIAAASILAKVTRDRLMEQYHIEYPEYGFDRHKGYGTADHIRAIETYGYCPIHRRSFHIRGLQNHG
jgi:ribonuclease HII